MSALGLVLLILWAVCFLYMHITFRTYNETDMRCGKKAEDVAREILQSRHIRGVAVFLANGYTFTDNYNPWSRTINLTENVYRGRSVSAVAVAAHQAGHALRHADRGIFGIIADLLAPAFKLASGVWFFFIFFAFAPVRSVSSSALEFKNHCFAIGTYILSAVLLFQLVTVPVEFDASSRAFKILCDKNELTEDEKQSARKVLFAACMPYIASAFMLFVPLINFLWKLRRRRFFDD